MTEKTLKQRLGESYLSSGADAYLDDIYEDYLKDPNSVSDEWRLYFENLADKTSSIPSDTPHSDIREYFLQLARQPIKRLPADGVDLLHERKQSKVIDLIFAYRNLGHLQADLDPLGLHTPSENPVLSLAYYGLSDADLNTSFDVGSLLGIKNNAATLKEIYDLLRRTYCSTIGIEYMHITHQDEVNWIQQRIEQQWPNYRPTHDEQEKILEKLVYADGFEKYLGFKYVGNKRFSLEGGDSLIPLLDLMLNRGSENGVKEVVIGMPHRGRLNVLVNVLGIEAKQIFDIFEGKGIEKKFSGDVKYHLGYSSNMKTPSGSLHVALAFNPSHLEIVSPVVQGSVRARQRRRRDVDQRQVLPIQLHGDAAFAGQGCVMETFNMSQLRWFGVGGSIHIVVNNQIGFTISDTRDSRSTRYCTDVAKMVEAPVLHVNGNDPEAVFFAGQLAIDYRNKFKKDVVIDMICYRRHGHNEADEPSATQPIMYQIIKKMPAPCSIYAKRLVADGTIDANKEAAMADAYRKDLDENRSVIKEISDDSEYEYSISWEPYLNNEWTQEVTTSVPVDRLKAIAQKLELLPENFTLQMQVKKMMEARQKMTQGELPLNWGYAETLAYATLLDEGYPIRLCGQDAGRGTFAHRHAVLHDQNSNDLYIPLSHVSDQQAQINVIDSFLSEEAVLAFEYGFASANPNNLVIWEAQFGDFVNGAQVVIDQFISSGEQKWKRLCGLTLFLPHGYEGAGPEHSSARLERFMQLCAQHNMQVCVPSTPAQTFHMIRRQMIRPYRKPLIVMTPKSLLRHPLAVSSLTDLTEGKFENVLPELDELNAKNIRRVILCCGKVYYDLLAARRDRKLENIAILRIEQLYPFPGDDLKALLKPYEHVNDFVWCQEEPKNQGAWYSSQHNIRKCLQSGQKLYYVGRPASASPAAGYMSVHQAEQNLFINKALTLKTN